MDNKKTKIKNIVIAVLAVVIIACVVILVVRINTNKKNQTGDTQTETQSTYTGKRSGQFEIDYAAQVTKLADYSAIPVELSSSYEVTDDSENEYLTSILTTYGADAYKQITDRDTVEESDYVKVDYTGYQNGKAFDGGSATGVLLDVAGNSQVGGTSFIEGFTKPVIGAKVGDTVQGDVTFPDDYSQSSLAGQTVTFEYTIDGIYSKDPVTLADLTDEQVNTVFGSKAGVTTVADLKTQIEKDLQQNQYSAEVDQIKQYMIDNSDVTIPDDYFAARLNEYEESFKKDNLSDGQTLDDYLSKNYNMTADDARDKWKENLTDQIKVEFIFGLIAEKEDIEMDEDTYNSYISYIVSASNGQMADDNAVYEYFGSGHADEGEKYLKAQFLVNRALDSVADNAKVTFNDTSSDSTQTQEN